MIPLIIDTMPIPELIFIAIVMIVALDVAIEFTNPVALIIWVIAFIFLLFSGLFDLPLEWFYLTMVLDAIVLAMGMAMRMGRGGQA